MNMPKGGHVQEGTQNENDSKASMTSREMLKVSNVYMPCAKAAERSANLVGLRCSLPPDHWFIKGECLQEVHIMTSVLRAIAILNRSHDSISKDRELASDGPHPLLKLGHVRGGGQHAREVVVSCRLLPLLIEQIG